MTDYTPSWNLEQSEGPNKTPDSEKYGGGVDFDHEAARKTTGSVANVERGDSSGESQLLPDTPEWVDDTVARTRGDLTPDSTPATRCPNCVGEFARAAYQCAEFPHTSAFYQLIERHELALAGVFKETDTTLPDVGDDDEVWVSRDGLAVIVSNGIRDSSADRLPMASYVDVEGPAESVASFVEDMLTLAVQVKRELRAPSLESDADAARRKGTRVPDNDRLIERNFAAGVVSRLSHGVGE